MATVRKEADFEVADRASAQKASEEDVAAEDALSATETMEGTVSRHRKMVDSAIVNSMESLNQLALKVAHMSKRLELLEKKSDPSEKFQQNDTTSLSEALLMSRLLQILKCSAPDISQKAEENLIEFVKACHANSFTEPCCVTQPFLDKTISLTIDKYSRFAETSNVQYRFTFALPKSIDFQNIFIYPTILRARNFVHSLEGLCSPITHVVLPN
jgi:hypothetical protein